MESVQLLSEDQSELRKPRVHTHRLAAAMAILVVVLFGWLAATTIAHIAEPAEDAAMLFRYAENLSNGHGVVWNVGEQPLDGATDFGVMVAVAALAMVGIDPPAGMVILDLLAIAATLALVASVAVRLHHRSVVTAAIACWAILVSNVWLYVEVGFAAPIFGLACGCVVAAGQWVITRPSDRRAAVTLGLLAVVAGLVRPEGVIVAALVGLTVVVATGRRSVEPLRRAAAVAVPLGLLYFLGRWAYFGHPLPNPYYKKGGGSLYPDSLGVAFDELLRTCRPFLWVFPFGMVTGRWRLAVAYLVPIVGTTVMWVLLSDEMNYFGRFQYPIVVICAVSWPAFVGPIEDAARRVLAGRQVLAGALSAALLVLAVNSLIPVAQTVGQVAGADSRASIGSELAAIDSPAGYEPSMAVTEAGLLPYKSGWRALDTWGLNDAEIARSGEVTQERLDDLGPDLILSHAAFMPDEFPSEPASEWDSMTAVINDWALSNSYDLVRCWGVPGDTFFYWVKPDSPIREEIAVAVSPEEYRVSYSSAALADRCVEPR